MLRDGNVLPNRGESTSLVTFVIGAAGLSERPPTPWI